MSWCSGSFWSTSLPLWATPSSSEPTTNQSTAAPTIPRAQQAFVDQQPCPTPAIPPPSAHPLVPATPIPAPTASPTLALTAHCSSGTSGGLAARRRRPLLTLPLAPTGACSSPSRPNSRSGSSSTPLASTTASIPRPLSQAALLSPILVLPSPKSPHSIIEREARLTPSDPRMLSLSPRPPAPTATGARRFGGGGGRLRQGGPRSPMAAATLFDDWDAWEDSTPLRPPRYGDHRGSRRMENAEADAWWAHMVDVMERQSRGQHDALMTHVAASGRAPPPAYNTVAIVNT